MSQFLSNYLHNNTMERIATVMEQLKESFGEKFTELTWSQQLDLTIKVINQEKTSLVKQRFYFDLISHIVPWVIAALALIYK